MGMHCSFRRKLFTSSPHLAPIQLPSPKEAHIWYVRPNEVKSEALLKQYMEILSPIEKENVLRLGGNEQQKTALVARALVRTTIARYSHVDPKSLKFRKSIHGKPEVEWQQIDHWESPPLHFNISHTNSLVACGITADSHIGIDVEEKQRAILNNILNLARRYFSQHEYDFLYSIKDSQTRHQEFIKLWTLKEAYVKALGVGFSGAPFKTFSIHFKNSARGSPHLSLDSGYKAFDIAVDDHDENRQKIARHSQFALIELDGSHYASICTQNGCPKTSGELSDPMKMKVWKTVPYTDAIAEVNVLA